jgi:general L-amino acid transport system substrate-binding protein
VIRSRGFVVCALDAHRPDFDPDFSFEVDLCRALAAAVFDDPLAIEVQTLDFNAAGDALRTHAIDVYFGQLFTTSDDIHLGPALFVDAVGALARNDVGIHVLADLNFVTVCLMPDALESRLFDQVALSARVPYQAVMNTAGDFDAMYAAYDRGQCDAVVDDRIRLAQRRLTLSAPREHILLDLSVQIGSRGPLTARDDANWVAIVDAVLHGLIQAERLGVTSGNLEEALLSEDAASRRLLGVEGDAGATLGLSADFVARAIRHVGNYGEIYDRYYGATAGLNLPRDLNDLLENGGMIAAP